MTPALVRLSVAELLGAWSGGLDVAHLADAFVASESCAGVPRD